VEHTLGYTIDMDLNNGSGNYNIEERVYQGANLAYSTASADVKDWDPITQKIQLINIIGQFQANANVIGSTSNTIYNVSIFDDLGDNTDYDTYDNRNIQTEADAFIDFSEINPFGKP
jgi:hypothetical protein